MLAKAGDSLAAAAATLPTGIAGTGPAGLGAARESIVRMEALVVTTLEEDETAISEISAPPEVEVEVAAGRGRTLVSLSDSASECTIAAAEAGEPA
jgi:hypothetical protein